MPLPPNFTAYARSWGSEARPKVATQLRPASPRTCLLRRLECETARQAKQACCTTKGSKASTRIASNGFTHSLQLRDAKLGYRAPASTFVAIASSEATPSEASTRSMYSCTTQPALAGRVGKRWCRGPGRWPNCFACFASVHGTQALHHPACT